MKRNEKPTLVQLKCVCNFPKTRSIIPRKPTLDQLRKIRDLLIDLGITGQSLDSLFGVKVPVKYEGHHIAYELSATVSFNCPYLEALEDAVPKTRADSFARQVADEYPPSNEGERKKIRYVLLNFSRGGLFGCESGWEKALAWAKQKGYGITDPREVFAVVKQHKLCKLLDRDDIFLYATIDCPFGFQDSRWALYVRIAGLSQTYADLHPLDDEKGYATQWFLFRKTKI